jgi:glycosyltransferase involved in cell wall biosynthesis
MKIAIIAATGEGGSTVSARSHFDLISTIPEFDVVYFEIPNVAPKTLSRKYKYIFSNKIIALLSSFFRMPISWEFFFSYGRLPDLSNFDIVHFHWIQRRGIPLMKMDLKGKKVFWTLHDSWPLNGLIHLPDLKVHSRTKRVAIKWLSSRTKKLLGSFVERSKVSFVSPSEFIAIKCREAWPKSNVFTIRNRLHQTYLNFDNAIQGVRQNAFLFVGGESTKNDYKGSDFFFDISKKLERSDPVSELWYVGDFSRKSSSQIPNNVKFLGQIKDSNEMRRIYTSVKATLILSGFENYPNVALESMSCLTPVIGFDVGGIGEIVVAGSGNLHPYGDTSAVFSSMMNVDSIAPNELLKDAREKLRVEQNKLIHNYLQIYL